MKKSIHYTIFPRLAQKRIFFISVISVFIFLIIWFLLSKFNIIAPVILPAPSSILESFMTVIQNGYADKSLPLHIGISLQRVFLSLALAIIFAIPLGVLVAVNDFIKGIVDPFVEFYRPLPPLAYLPLVIIWFGIGEMSKVILIFLAIFAPIFLNTRAGVLSIPSERLNAAVSLGASKLQLLFHIILPSTLLSILTGVRIGIGFGWTTLVAAEMVASSSGLGYMVLTASEFLQTQVVIVGIFIIGLLAFTTDLIMRALINYFIHWQGK